MYFGVQSNFVSPYSMLSSDAHLSAKEDEARRGKLPLWKPVSGFNCKGCRRKVTVVITAPMQWA